MARQIFTLDNLYQFFVNQNQTIKFNSKESGAPIVVTTSGYFEAEEDNMPGMLKLKLKVCHTETNRNGSHISKENMEKAMPTLKYRPILAYIHDLPDGTKDFYAHNMEIVENEDGEAELVYIEKQVGCFTAEEPWLEYDKKADKTYVMAYAVIPEFYTEAADIIRAKNGTKVSCELVINELAYNAKEKYLDLTDFYFGGTTLLGKDEDGNEIGEGMEGSRADIKDFCYKAPTFTYQDKLIETLEKLNITLSSFNNTQSNKEGGDEEMDNVETVVMEEEVETVTEEVVVEESLVEEETTEEIHNEEETIVENASTSEDGEGEDGNFDEEEVEIPEQQFVLKYELSHDDVRCALYKLISVASDSEYTYRWIAEVYDDKFIYEDCGAECRFYRQAYSKDGDNIALEGEPVEVFSEWLSKSEKEALDALKADYAALEVKYNELVQFKADVDAAQAQAQKDAIFANEKYSNVAGTKAFKKLVENAKDYSVEECEQKANDILDDYSDFAVTFAVNGNKKSNTIGFAFNVEKTEPAYGGLFEKKK